MSCRTSSGRPAGVGVCHPGFPPNRRQRQGRCRGSRSASSGKSVRESVSAMLTGDRRSDLSALQPHCEGVDATRYFAAGQRRCCTSRQALSRQEGGARQVERTSTTAEISGKRLRRGRGKAQRQRIFRLEERLPAARNLAMTCLMPRRWQRLDLAEIALGLALRERRQVPAARGAAFSAWQRYAVGDGSRRVRSTPCGRRSAAQGEPFPARWRILIQHRDAQRVGSARSRCPGDESR